MKRQGDVPDAEGSASLSPPRATPGRTPVSWRKPLSLRFREAAQWVGLVFLGLLMVLVFYNDIGRLVTRLSTKTEVEMPVKTQPQPASALPGGDREEP